MVLGTSNTPSHHDHVIFTTCKWHFLFWNGVTVTFGNLWLFAASISMRLKYFFEYWYRSYNDRGVSRPAHWHHDRQFSSRAELPYCGAWIIYTMIVDFFLMTNKEIFKRKFGFSRVVLDFVVTLPLICFQSAEQDHDFFNSHKKNWPRRGC